MSPQTFCFSTVASRNYIGHAAGLWANIRRFHPGVPLVVLAIDDQTLRFFSRAHRPGLLCVPAEQAWGSARWRNLKARTNVPERAYASKAALIHWILESGTADSSLMLDADVVLLAPLDDIIERCRRSELVLVPTRHDLDAWRRSQRAGLFSAGFVGFSVRGRRLAAAWRAMCFEQCTALPIDGTYNEQKYLEYLVGHADADIVRDAGVNLSATTFAIVAPRKGEDGAWRAADGTPIRLFHVSRTTDPGLELSRIKTGYNRDALKSLGGEEYLSPVDDGQASGRDGKGAGTGAGRFFDRAQGKLQGFFRNVVRLQRAWRAQGLPLRVRLREAFRDRRALEQELWDEARDGGAKPEEDRPKAASGLPKNPITIQGSPQRPAESSSR